MNNVEVRALQSNIFQLLAGVPNMKVVNKPLRIKNTGFSFRQSKEGEFFE